MPIEVSELKTKSGYPVLRANFIAEVTVAEATRYHQSVIKSGPYDGWGHLVVGNVTGVSSEVKKVLASEKTDAKNPAPVALILSSALARMAASLTMRIASGSTGAWPCTSPGAEALPAGPPRRTIRL